MNTDIDLAALFSRLETNRMEEMKVQIEALQASLEALTTRLTTIEKPTVVKEYKDEVPVTTKASLTAFKALPEFHGKIEEYPSWRNLVTTTMKYISKADDENYLNALLLIKAKIRGPAAAILSNHGTPLNFDAIIDRLDYSYADQRAMYVIEQELIVLQQGGMTVHQFYDKINEKLNMIITKIHMTHKEKVAADVLIENMRDKALRTFITGLSNKTGDVLYSSNPKTLAEAYARLQTILSDRERISFATQFNRNEVVSNNINRNRNEVNQYNHSDDKMFITKGRMQNQIHNTEKRDRFDSQRNPNFAWKNEQRNPNFMSKREQSIVNKPNVAGPGTQVEPMDIDKSSMHVNVEDIKRKFNPSVSNQYSRQHKVQRVNNIENEIGEREEYNDIDETLSEASVFLE